MTSHDRDEALRAVDAYLGDFRDQVTDEQAETLAGAFVRINELAGGDRELVEDASAAAVMAVLGDLDLDRVGRDYRRSKAKLEAYALGAVLAGVPEVEAARLSTLDRMTIRRLQGKDKRGR